MKIRNIMRGTVALQGAAFFLVLVLVWLDAIFAWHHWPRQVEHTVDWDQLRALTTAVAVLAVVVMLATHRLQARIMDLERFIRVCAWCRKVEMRHHWVEMEEFLSTKLHKETTHGICPECRAREFAEETVPMRPASHAA